MSCVSRVFSGFGFGLAVLFVPAVTPACAAVEPLQTVIPMQSQYTPPPGKIVIIEHILIDPRSSFRLVIEGHTNELHPIASSQGSPDLAEMCSFNRPLRLVAPSRIETGWFYLTLLGLLVDPEDLYAGIPSVLGAPELKDGARLQSTVQIPSPRPHVVKAETTSGAFDGWKPDTNAVVTATTNRAVDVVSLPTTRTNQFLRVAVRARRE